MTTGRIIFSLLKYVVFVAAGDILHLLGLLDALSLALACHLVLQSLQINKVTLRLMLTHKHLTNNVACHWSHNRQHNLLKKSVYFHFLASIFTDALYVDWPEGAQRLRSILLLIKKRQARQILFCRLLFDGI